jgi:hypothetical protein
MAVPQPPARQAGELRMIVAAGKDLSNARQTDLA